MANASRRIRKYFGLFFQKSEGDSLSGEKASAVTRLKKKKKRGAKAHLSFDVRFGLLSIFFGLMIGSFCDYTEGVKSL